MSPARRRGKVWWTLGALVALGILIIAYVSGVLPVGQAKEEKKALCWVSPQNPNYIKEVPGKDPEGNALVPVYPTPSGEKPGGPAVAPAPTSERKIKHWVSSMDPKYVRDKPGKDYMGMDLVPVYEEAAPPPTAVAPAPGAQKERKIKYWVSPMDPGYVRDKPGKAPCGMDMVPVYEDEGGAAGPGAIAVSPTTLQSMGVRTAKVEVRPLTHDTWTVGLITVNERNLSVVNTKVAGWVERLYINATGDPVRRGQALLSIYSPDLVSAQDEYLLALRNLKNLEKSPYPEMAEGARRLAEASRRRLEYFDVSAGQIEALKTSGHVKKHLVLASPAKGIVTKRMVTQGQMVQAGMPLLEVADLSTIWVDADIYQYELPWIKVGQKVEMSLNYMPGETFAGRIDYIYPFLKEASRTVRVRLRFPNPQLKLKPEMFSQVQIKSPVTKEVVVVPTEAVLDTGLKQHVFIALGGGKFEPRELKLGVYGDGNNYREVLSGLKGGEEIVTSAQFLLDSESRFREAVQMMLAPQGAPEPGKEAAPPARPGMPGMKMEGTKEAAPAAPAPAPMPPGPKH
ncbi:MAG: efflux RND transporter periplasmic adaptor subunit [Deltaproteobacteria bacterium]|nr:efflux RND transporter periplasmic adaptor subunit [Deltaproteobacteria bacterium]